ncbi:MAG: SMP-30/gluconolactonase/LRE family protein [Roseiarcus sp.]|uniref:SMP-30/gluconolactonase/LRE family protein n=1 Tax=Roseiarcus sp. TaxID=1969460 RepID=UPI003BAE1BCF
MQSARKPLVNHRVSSDRYRPDAGSATIRLRNAGWDRGSFFDAADIVDESAVDDERSNPLLWVDIGGKRIHCLRLAEHRHEALWAPDFPTSIGLRADGGAIVGLSDRPGLRQE